MHPAPYTVPQATSLVSAFKILSHIWSAFHTSADATLAQVQVISCLDYFDSLLSGTPCPNFIRSCHSAHKPLRVKTLITICKATMVRPPVMTSLTPWPSTPHRSVLSQSHWPTWHPYTYSLCSCLSLCTCYSIFLEYSFLRCPHGSSLYSNVTFSVRPFLTILSKILLFSLKLYMLLSCFIFAF